MFEGFLTYGITSSDRLKFFLKKKKIISSKKTSKEILFSKEIFQVFIYENSS